MKRHSPTRATALVTGLFVWGMFTGAVAGRAAVARAEDPYASLDLFVRVLNTIERDYVDVIETDRLIEAAIDGMVDELDPQSRWLSASEYSELQDDTEGATTGIGIEVARTGNAVVVVRVMPGSPAVRDGLAAGDQILAIDGVALDRLELHDIQAQFKGDRGEQALLTVVRDGWDEPREIRTVRDRLERPAVEAGLIDSDIAYIRLVVFQEGAAREIETRLAAVADDLGGVSALGGLVLDLRDNPGGLLTEAVAVTDLFLDDGVIVSTHGRRSSVQGDAGAPEEHHATRGGLGQDLPVAVVVNGMSASASEIVAGALQDTGRGTLVGETTYGKGTVQQVYRHLRPAEAALKLTVGRYYTPSGAPVAPREGREPDHVVPWHEGETPAGTLRKRLAALQLPADERVELLELVDALPDEVPGAPDIPWGAPLEERYAADPQLQRAVAALREG